MKCFGIYFILFVGCCSWWNKCESRIATLEFDRDRKSMGVITRSLSGKNSLLVKVLSHSSSEEISTIITCCRVVILETLKKEE